MKNLPDVRWEPLVFEAHDSMHGIENDSRCFSTPELRITRDELMVSLDQIQKFPDVLEQSSYDLEETKVDRTAKVLLHMRALLRNTREFRDWILSALKGVESAVISSRHHVRLIHEYQKVFTMDEPTSLPSDGSDGLPPCNLSSLDRAHTAVHDLSYDLCREIMGRSEQGEGVLRITLPLVESAIDRLVRDIHIEAQSTMKRRLADIPYEVLADFIRNAGVIFESIREIRNWLRDAVVHSGQSVDHLSSVVRAFDDAIAWRI